MILKRVSLPFPPQAEAPGPSVERMNSEEVVALFSSQIADLNQQIEVLTARAIESICGGTDETQDVELYDGTLGVPRGFVDQYESPVGQLKWLDNLADRFRGPNDSSGNVSGQRWGSGGLISKDFFLTAGHCFDQGAGAWGFPHRNGQIISSDEIATSMEVSFKYQVDGTSPTRRVREGERFPVVELLEHRFGGIDYAIVRLGRNGNNELPGERYGWFTVAPEDVIQSASMLCLIQHLNGQPKRVEAGPMQDNLGGRITYDSLDTTGGSSGSLLLHYPSGNVVGVHTNGGCTRISGFNYGVAIGIIRLASAYLKQVDQLPSSGGTSAPTSTDARLARLNRVFDAIAEVLS